MVPSFIIDIFFLGLLLAFLAVLALFLRLTARLFVEADHPREDLEER